jgi:RNA polymerase sigma-70 factor (ECF subfamily)
MTARTSDSTSSSLLMQVKAKDPEAWRRLADLYAPLVYQWCRQAGLAESDVADVSQNAFTAVYKSIETFRRRDGDDNFRGWLWRVTRNEVLMLFRRRAKEPPAAGGTHAQQAMQQLPDYFGSEAAPSDRGTERNLLRRAAQIIRDEFEVNTQEAFWRVAIDGQAATDVAEQLGMSHGAVRQAKYRVLKRLREFMSED